MNGWGKSLTLALVGLLAVYVLSDWRADLSDHERRLRALERELTALTAGRRAP